MMMMLYFEWLAFGLFASYEFGKMAQDGTMLPLVLSTLSGCAGTVAMLFIARRTIRNRNQSALVMLVVASVVGLIVSSRFVDIQLHGTGNAGLGAAIYFLLSICVAGICLFIAWRQHGLDNKKKNSETLEAARRQALEDLISTPRVDVHTILKSSSDV